MENLLDRITVETDVDEQRKLAERLSTYRLVDIVAALGPKLTGEAPQRSSANRILVQILGCGKEMPSRDSELMLKFMLSRLEDASSVEYALDGISTLVERYNVYDGVLDTIKSMDIKSLPQPLRHKIYLILKLLRARVPVDQFVPTFADVASGEKDPQNLMVSLSISHDVLQFSGDTLTDQQSTDIFDVTFCYFPVTFNPPKDMPYKITADDIRQSLRATLVSPHLAKWVIPALIEKLTAVSTQVKVDSLETLREALLNTDRQLYWHKVWDGVRYEVLYGTPDSETLQPAISVLKTLATLPEFVDTLEKELEAKISGDNAKPLDIQMAYLLVGLSTGSDRIWRDLVPVAINNVLSFPSPDPALLKVFITASSSTRTLPFIDRIVQELLHKRDPEAVEDLRLLAISSSDHAPLIVHALVEASATQALASIARVRSDVIISYCMPQLLATIPDGLQALGEICVTKPLVHKLAVRLLSRLESDKAFAIESIESLLVATSHLKQDELSSFDRFIPQLLSLFVGPGAIQSAIIIDRSCMLIESWARAMSIRQQLATAGDLSILLDKGLPYALYVSTVVSFKDCPFPQMSLTGTVKALASVHTVFERAPYLRLLAVTLNKWPDHVPEYKEDFKTLLANLDHPDSLEVLAWGAKGLLFKGDNYGFEVAASLTDAVPHSALAARVYGVLVSPDRFFVPENGVIIRQLFRQRLFARALPVLLETGNANSMLALSALVRFVNRSVVMQQFDKILPLFLSTIESPHAAPPRAQETALECLRSAVTTHKEIFENILDTLTQKLLYLAKQGRSPNVRARAISLLIALKQQFPTLGEGNTKIQTNLSSALSDPKRDVRRLAAECRQLFF